MRIFSVVLIFLFMSVLCVQAEEISINAREYGAVGDAKEDDMAAIQEALDQAHENGGGEVFLPAGKYLVKDSLSIPSGVTLKGVWSAPHHQDQSWGTTLHAVAHRGEEEGPAFIQLSPSSAIEGLTIYYPEQVFEDIQPYPWTIKGSGMHGSVTNVTLVNAYQGIHFGVPHELHYIRNVFGCVLRRGVYIDHCTDIGRIENVHFNPHYWKRAKLPEEQQVKNMGALIAYLNENVEAFIFGRTDWEYVLNTFVYGFEKGYAFIQTESGGCNGNFLGIGADGGQYALWVEATQPYGLLITNGEFVTFAGDTPTEVVTTESFDGVVQLNNCAFWGPAHRNAKLQGTGHVAFHQCNFQHWGKDDLEAESLRIEGGSVSVSNCRFALENPHIYLGSEVLSAVVTGNTFVGERKITNESEGEVQISNNVSRKK